MNWFQKLRNRGRPTVKDLDAGTIATTDVHQRCLALFRQLRELRPYSKKLDLYRPIVLPSAHYHEFVPYIEEWIQATKKSRKTNFGDMRIERTTTDLESFFITPDGHYGDLEVIMDRFCGLVIEFCTTMLEITELHHGPQAYNRHQSCWLAYCLIDCVKTLMPDRVADIEPS